MPGKHKHGNHGHAHHRHAIVGTDGDDILLGDDHKDRIIGKDGDDYLSGEGGKDHLKGGDGNDTLLGGDGKDKLDGGDGDDVLSGGDGNDHLKGGDGDDTLSGDAGNDKLKGGDGDDTFVYVYGTEAGGKDRIDGNHGHDTLRLVVTQAELAAIQSELDAYEAHIQNSNRSFSFSFGLKVKSVENLQVEILDGGNTPPEVSGPVDGGATDEDAAPLTLDLLANASDADGDDLDTDGVTVTSSNAGRTVIFSVDDETGELTIDPAQFNDLAAGESEQLSVSYDVIDGNGGVTSATATLSVDGVNDAPTDISLSDNAVDENAPGAVIGQLMGSDPDLNDLLTLEVVGNPDFEVDASGQLKLVDGVALDFEAGPITVAVSATDPSGASFTKFFDIAVSNQNDAPEVSGPVLGGSTDEDAAPVTIDLLANASDQDGDSLDVASVVVTASNGDPVAVASINHDTGALTIDPAQFNSLAVNETETLTVDFNVIDGNGGVMAATAALEVNGINDAPDVSGPVDGGITNEDAAPAVIDLLANASDVDGDNLDVASVTVTTSNGDPVAIALIDYATGELTIDPGQFNSLAAGESETLDITYDVVDGNGGVAPATAVLVVEGRNDAPESVGGFFPADAIEVFTDVDATEPLSIFDVTGGFTDVDSSDNLTYSATLAGGAPLPSWMTLDAVTGQLYVDQADAAGGSYAVAISATDGLAVTAPEVVAVDVVPVARGTGADGYVDGATVFSDDDNSGALNGLEASTTTDSDGDFVLVGATGPLVMTGGIDISTGKAFEGSLRAPTGSTQISPLTTLILETIEAGGGNISDAAQIAAANVDVLDAFGLNNSLDLTTYDQIIATRDNGTGVAQSDGEFVHSAAVQVQNTAALIGHLMVSGGVVLNDGVNAAFTEIGNQVDPNNIATVDLTDAPTLAAIINSVALTFGVTLGVGVDLSAADLIVRINEYVANDTSSGTDFLEVAAKAGHASHGGSQAAGAMEIGTTAAIDGLIAVDIFLGAVALNVTGSKGSSGNDTLDGGATPDIIDGLGGDDTISGHGDDDHLIGSGGDDDLFGGAGADTLDGGDDDDTMAGGAGDDDISGGTGSDTVDYSQESGGGAVTVGLSPSGGTATDTFGDSDTLTGVENAIGTDQNDTLNGGSADNRLQGNGGDDAIDGGDGNDTAVFSGALADYIIGQSGSDITVTDTIGGRDGSDTLVNVEVLDFSDQSINLPTDILLTNQNVVENSDGAAIGNISVIDGDAGENHSYTLSDSRFEVAAGVLRLKAGETLDHEAEGSILLTVRATGDDDGLFREETFTITVDDANDNPVADDDVGATLDTEVLVVAAANGLLQGDTDQDGDSLTVTAGPIVSAQGAAVTLAADGSYTYDATGTPFADGLLHGATFDDSFAYQVEDGQGGTDTATVTITVTGNGVVAAGDVSDTAQSPLIVGDTGVGTLDVFDGAAPSHDQVILGGQIGGDGTVAIDATGAATSWAIGAGGLRVGAGGDGQMTVSGGATVTAGTTNYDSVYVGGSGGLGTLNITGAGSSLTTLGDTNRVTVGVSGGEGWLNVSDSANLDSFGLQVGSAGTGHAVFSNNAVVTISSENGIHTSPNERYAPTIRVGYQNGDGDLTVESGAKLYIRPGLTNNTDTDFPGLQIGRDGGTGSVVVDGQNSLIEISKGHTEPDNGPYLQVGRSGVGDLTIRNEGTFTLEGGRGSMVIGRDSSGDGTMTVDGLNSSFNIIMDPGFAGWSGATVGQNGTAVLDVTGGASANMEVSGFNIAQNAGSVGDVLVDGSSVSIWGGIEVGNAGSGTLTLDHGATFSAATNQVGSLNVGNHDTADGHLSLDNGSSLTFTTGDAGQWTGFNIGGDGSGIVDIRGGSSITMDVQNAGGGIANSAGSYGELNISGSGSSFSMSQGNVFVAGGYGAVGVTTTGKILVEDGGALTLQSVHFGDQEGSHGELTVTGIGSTATFNEDYGDAVAIGGYGGGTGLVDVNNGGLLSAGGNVAVHQNGRLTGGGGTIDAGTTVVYEGGVIAPGNSTGTMTINNGLEVWSGTLEFEVAGGVQGAAVGGYDLLDVNGVATVHDGVMHFIFDGFGPALNDTFQVVKASNGASVDNMDFVSVAITGLQDGFNYDLSFDGNANGGITLTALNAGTFDAANGTVYFGSGLNDNFSSGDNDDIIMSGDGDNVFDTNGGWDVARFNGVIADYTISVEGGDTRVIDNNNADGDDGNSLFANIEELQFSDGTLSAATSITLDNSSVDENTAGAVVGNLTIVDPDSDTDTITVDDARFEVVAGQLMLTAGTSLDHEAAATVDVTVTVTDLAGLTTSQTFVVNVQDLNDGPVAADDAENADADTAEAIVVLANDTDQDVTATLSVLSVDAVSAEGAALSINGDGSIQYDPTASASLGSLILGDNVLDSFSYTVQDDLGVTDTATVYVTVAGQNVIPAGSTTVGDVGNPLDAILIVGDTGVGSLDILGATVLNNDGGIIGNTPSGDGTVNVQYAGATWNLGDSGLYVGKDGLGSLTVQAGGQVNIATDNFTHLVVGGSAIGDGQLTVDGIGSQITTTGSLSSVEIGRYGSTGDLMVSNGGQVDTLLFYVGTDAGGVGTATITGAGSTVTASTDVGLLTGGNSDFAGFVFVGRDGGAGALNVLDGGRLEVRNGIGVNEDTDLPTLYIGRNDGDGTVLVDGAGSEIAVTQSQPDGEGNNGPRIIVGREGSTSSGDLTISNGGTVTVSGPNAQFVAAQHAGNTGDVTVTGANSSLVVDAQGNNGRFSIGDNGTGTLEISDGASVNAQTASFAVGDYGNGSLTLLTGATLVTNDFEVAGVANISGNTGTVTVDATSSITANGDYVNVGGGGYWDGDTPADPADDWGDAAGTSTGTLTLDGTMTANQSMSLGNQQRGTGTVTVNGGGMLDIAQNFDVGRQGAGTLTVNAGGIVSVGNDMSVASTGGSAGTVTVAAAANLDVGSAISIGAGSYNDNGTPSLNDDWGQASTGYGSLAVQGSVTADSVYLGGGQYGHGSIDMNGGSIIVDGYTIIGDIATGIMTMTNGAALTTGDLDIASAGGSTGDLTLDGTSSVSTGSLSVGNGQYSDSGTPGDPSDDWGINAPAYGTLTINGGTVTATDTYIGGNQNLGNGTVVVNGGGMLDVTQRLEVGQQGVGTLSINAGSSVSVGDHMSIANTGGSTGTVTVAAAASLNVVSAIWIGDGSYDDNGTPSTEDDWGQALTGYGSLTVQGSVTADTVSVGGGQYGHGTLNVDGGSLSYASDTWIGSRDGGVGTASISNGGVVTNTGGWTFGIDGDGFGNSALNGTVTVDGAGSMLDIQHGGIDVGHRGTGVLDISNGASVFGKDNVTIGNAAGATGTVTIDATSSLSTDGNLNVGSGGYDVGGDGIANTEDDWGIQGGTGLGTLTINGGTVNAARLEAGVDRGGDGTVTMNGGSLALTGTGYHGMASIGGLGQGALIMIGASLEAEDWFSIADGASDAGTTGTVTLDAASSITVGNNGMSIGNGAYWVGGDGVPGGGDDYGDETGTATGVLNINGGSVTVTAGGLVVGGGTRGTGTINMDGGSITASGHATVGSAGTGTMNMINGATLTTGDLDIAGAGGSNGDLTLDGTSSVITGNLTVGNGYFNDNGTPGDPYDDWGVDAPAFGTLTVDGGTVTASHVSIGSYQSLANGILTLNGGSLDAGVGDINIGDGGTGLLDLWAGADVTAGNIWMNSGGTLSGDGVISGNVTAGDGALVTPGHSTGMLAINGMFDLTGGQVDIEVAGAADFDLLDVAGDTHFNNGVLHLNFTGYAPTANEAYLFIEGDGIVNYDPSGVGIAVTGLAGGYLAPTLSNVATVGLTATMDDHPFLLSADTTFFFGSDGDDEFDAGAGDDTLTGGQGNDTLTGGTGVDTLTGGLNDDIFVFADGDGVDTVTDFEDGIDLLDVSAMLVADSSGFVITGNSTTNVTVDFGAGDTVTLIGVSPITVDDADFLFA